MEDCWYRVPECGLLTIALFNPHRTLLKTFLLNYDLKGTAIYSLSYPLALSLFPSFSVDRTLYILLPVSLSTFDTHFSFFPKICRSITSPSFSSESSPRRTPTTPTTPSISTLHLSLRRTTRPPHTAHHLLLNESRSLPPLPPRPLQPFSPLHPPLRLRTCLSIAK